MQFAELRTGIFYNTKKNTLVIRPIVGIYLMLRPPTPTWILIGEL